MAKVKEELVASSIVAEDRKLACSAVFDQVGDGTYRIPLLADDGASRGLDLGILDTVRRDRGIEACDSARRRVSFFSFSTGLRRPLASNTHNGRPLRRCRLEL